MKAKCIIMNEIYAAQNGTVVLCSTGKNAFARVHLNNGHVVKVLHYKKS